MHYANLHQLTQTKNSFFVSISGVGRKITAIMSRYKEHISFDKAEKRSRSSSKIERSIKFTRKLASTTNLLRLCNQNFVLF